MSHLPSITVYLQPWSEQDLPLLEKLLGDPAMMEHLGGPETSEQIAQRHLRYLAMNTSGTGKMFTIVLEEGEKAGSIGYWDKEWRGEMVYEMGWSVLPSFQGRGIGAQAIYQALSFMTAEQKHSFVHAFPSILNGASNAICRKAGFSLLGEIEFEYPKGHLMRCNDWQWRL